MRGEAPQTWEMRSLGSSPMWPCNPTLSACPGCSHIKHVTSNQPHVHVEDEPSGQTWKMRSLGSSPM